MKGRGLVGIVMLALVAWSLLVMPSVAFLQGGPGGTWNTGVNVQNLGTEQAQAYLEFFDSSGNLVFTDTVTIEAGGNVNVYLPALDGGLPPGRYSMQISSSQPVAAVANNVNLDYKLGDSYLGSEGGESAAYLPLIFRNYHSYDSTIYAQNATASSQVITVALYPVGSSTAAETITSTVPAYTTQDFYLGDASFSSFGDTYGSAVVSGASGDIAVMVEYVKDTGAGASDIINGEYRGIAPSLAGRTLYSPLVFKYHNFWESGVNIQNTGSVTTTVTATYTASPNSPHYPLTVTDTRTIGPNSMDNFWLPGDASLPDGFYGGAVLSSDNADILAIVNNVNYERGEGDVGSCYEAFNPAAATASIAAPLVFRDHADVDTGINVQNVGGASTDISVTITKSPNSNPTGTGSPGPWGPYTATGVAPGEVAVFYLPTLMPDVSGLFGSVVITSTGGVDIAAVINSTRYAAGMSYNYVGINYD